MGAMIAKRTPPVNEEGVEVRSGAVRQARPDRRLGKKKALQERRLENLKGKEQKAMIHIIYNSPGKEVKNPKSVFTRSTLHRLEQSSPRRVTTS